MYILHSADVEATIVSFSARSPGQPEGLGRKRGALGSLRLLVGSDSSHHDATWARKISHLQNIEIRTGGRVTERNKTGGRNGRNSEKEREKLRRG